MRISRDRREKIREGRRRKGRGGVAGKGAKKGMKIPNRGNHEGGEKGKGRGGQRKGREAGREASRDPARGWRIVKQIAETGAGPGRQRLERTWLTEMAPPNDTGKSTLGMPADIYEPNP